MSENKISMENNELQKEKVTDLLKEMKGEKENLQPLTNILKNIKNYPEEEKYKSLNKSNQEISKFLTKNIIELMEYVGFENGKDKLYFKGNLSLLVDVLWIIENYISKGN